MKLLILAANGRIARIVEDRILNEDQFKDIELTLGLRHHQRLAKLADNDHVNVIETDLADADSVKKAIEGQDMVYVAILDQNSDNTMTKNVIDGMKANHVDRVIFTNLLGIFKEVPGEFGKWNQNQIADGIQISAGSNTLLENSGLTYTTLRLPWLNDRDEVKYSVTKKNEPYVGVSASRQSVADVVLRIVADPSFAANDSIGMADPDTQGETRPVY